MRNEKVVNTVILVDELAMRQALAKTNGSRYDLSLAVSLRRANEPATGKPYCKAAHRNRGLR